MKKTLILFLALFLLFLVSPGQAANKFWWGSCLIGGGDCLDGIDGADLTAGDGAIVIRDAGSNTPELYLYRLHESGTAEDSPRVISPDANAGTKRWHLANVFGVSFQTVAVDGYNRIKLTNNTTRDPAASSMEIYPEGNIWKLNVNGTEYTLGPINDSATNGETTQVWSADKIYDQLALKRDLTDTVAASEVDAVLKTDTACVTIGDWSNAITTGTKWYTAFRVPFKHDLGKIVLTTNQTTGNITIDVWKDAANATTGLAALTDADSLFDTASEPAIADASADNYFEVTSFDSGEATDVAAGTWYVVNIDSTATLTGVNVCFEFTRKD